MLNLQLNLTPTYPSDTDRLENPNMHIVSTSPHPSITGDIGPQEPIAVPALLTTSPSPNKVTERFVAWSGNTHLSCLCLVAMLTVALFAEFDKAVRGAQSVSPTSGIVRVPPAIVGACLGCNCSNESGHIGKGGLHGVDDGLLVYVRICIVASWIISIHNGRLLVFSWVVVRMLAVKRVVEEVKR